MGGNSRFAIALHTAALLAVKDSCLVSSELIAQSVSTNPVVVRRVVGALAKAGLVETCAGKCGGTRLKKAPARITLLDIYGAVESEGLFNIKGRVTNPRCEVSCHMKNVLVQTSMRAETALKRALRSITLSDIIRPLKS